MFASVIRPATHVEACLVQQVHDEQLLGRLEVVDNAHDSQPPKTVRIIGQTESYQKLTFKKGVTPKGAKPFPKGVSGNPAGRPPGSHSQDTMIRRILEGEEELPAAIAETIRKALGSDKKALQSRVRRS